MMTIKEKSTGAQSVRERILQHSGNDIAWRCKHISEDWFSARNVHQDSLPKRGRLAPVESAIAVETRSNHTELPPI